MVMEPTNGTVIAGLNANELLDVQDDNSPFINKVFLCVGLLYSFYYINVLFPSHFNPPHTHTHTISYITDLIQLREIITSFLNKVFNQIIK